jgi:deoxycytidine triphosphate deaminase
MQMPSLSEIVPQVGYLTDKQILRCLEAGLLVDKGTGDKGQIRHASYTLRLGSRIELARAADAIGSKTRELRLINLTKTHPDIDLQPGDTALLYSLEYLKFPNDVLGFTVARGLLFVEALTPENTYVDPGFSGPIYTTVTNVSNRVIQLSYGMSVARLYFFRLAEEVQDGYRAGSALGLAQQLTSVRAVPFGSTEELRSARDANLLESIRLIPIGGVHAAESLQRLNRRMLAADRRIMSIAIVWPILLVLANNSEWVNDNLGTFLGNVLASVVAALLMLFAPRVIAWIRSETDR